jgi:assimilatory nitrate reductase catalytic subunit
VTEKAGTRTTCPYCGVGCGIVARRSEDGTVSIAGDPGHPANFGRLCSKGSALAETIDLDGRLLHPEIGGRRVDWDTALDAVARGFAGTIAEHGPDSVAFYVSGQLLTEDYYVANKLMKGFIGAANIDTNSRLCMASSVAGHRRAFGADVVPGCYEDLEEADLVVLVGSNLAWCHPILFQRLLAAREKRPQLRIVAIDPRRTATAEVADLHLPVAPESDVALFAGLLAHLDIAGVVDAAYIARHTTGFAAALAEAHRFDAEAVARIVGVSRDTLATFYDWFAKTERVVTVYSQGVNQSVAGTDKVNAIINCHLATGRIARPGTGPFSITGQPNAMGGREVGGLANQLACHLDLENADHRSLVRRFWKSPRIADRPGLKAVDLFQAIDDGRIKALWIMATNPVDSLPDADRVKRGLAACPLVVVSEVVAATDTLPFANIRLPAAAWGEKDGTVTNSERVISRQRRFLPLPGEARPDWWIVAEVGRRMGFGAEFDYAGPAEIFREYATLTSIANAGRRPLDLGGIADLDRAGYDRLAPVQWPRPRDDSVDARRVFSDGVFATPDGRARFVVTRLRRPAEPVAASLPLVLNTGRVRDHWHTLTRTGKSPRLSSHIAEPFVEIAPGDAEKRGILPATLVRVASARGTVLLRARITETQRPGSVFVPMHWTDQYASAARIDALVGPATDPVSGQPGLKHTPVEIAPAGAAWYGFAVLKRSPQRIASDYWVLAKARGGIRLELAGLSALADPAMFARDLFGANEARRPELLSYHDAATNQHRFALLSDAGFEGALYLAPEPVAVARTWLAAMLTEAPADAQAGLRLLAGRPGADRPDDGALVCSCHDVGANRIAAAIAAGADTIDAVGFATRAGTNCGSCRSEIKRMLDHGRAAEARLARVY